MSMPRFAVVVGLVLGMGRSVLAQGADGTTIEILATTPLAVDPRLPFYATVTPAADRANHVTAASHLTESVKRSAAEAQKRYWPEFALGGAVIGGVGLAGFAVLKCDSNCRDDGSLGIWMPTLITAGAVGGAVVGAVVGLIVDSSRSP